VAKVREAILLPSHWLFCVPGAGMPVEIINKITLSKKTLKAMYEMGASDYARQQGWNIQAASQALSAVACLVCDEVNEPDDMTTLADIMMSLVEFIKGEISEMEDAAVRGITKSVPAEVKTVDMNFSYAKSMGIIPDTDLSKLAVKFVARDEIKGYSVLWGGPKVTDLELEYFTKDTDFWDATLKDSPRPLTWDHAQDEDFKAYPIIGKMVEFGEDEIGKWYVAKLDRSHKYRAAIDALIKEGKLGTSSDSAPQYVERVKTGKATWLKTWPLFAAALTDVPCEPRMIDSIEYLKSLGVTLPDAPQLAWEWDATEIDLLKIKTGEL
jgi:hypothetical protein